jgi:hypothetical protein
MKRMRLLARILMCSVLAVLVLEAAARIDDRINYGASIFDNYSNESLYIVDGSKKRGKPHARFKKWALNSLGFRGPELTDGGTRVVCFGSSETFGLYESEGNEFPRQLERHLNNESRGKKFQVVNVAYPGETLRSAAARVDEVVAFINPEFAIIYPSPGNYIWLPWLKPSSGARPNRFELRIAENVRTLGKEILPHSVQDRMRRREIARESAKYGTLPRLPQENVEVFQKDLATLVEELQNRGVKVLLVTHATYFQEPLDQRQKQLLTAWRRFFPMLEEDGFLDMESRMNEVVRRVAFQYQVPLIDAERKLPRGSENFADFSHLTDKGASELATEISIALVNVDTGRAAKPLSSGPPELSPDDPAKPPKDVFAVPTNQSSIPQR